MRAASHVWLTLFLDGVHAAVLEMTVGNHSVRYTSSGGVDAFLGVRYALPPLGQRRFAPAELMHQLPTDATQYGAPCLQDPSVDPNETPQPEAPLPSEGAFERSSRSTNELALGAHGPSLRVCRLFVPQHLAAGERGGPAASGYGPALRIATLAHALGAARDRLTTGVGAWWRIQCGDRQLGLAQRQHTGTRARADGRNVELQARLQNARL